MSSIAERILELHGMAALAVVFLLPALESSAFVGFVFPGEIGVLLGGVLASQEKVHVVAVLLAAITGAIVGDSIGYEVGKRWGRRLLQSSLGRVVKPDHFERAERYLQERGGKAVFLGRFTAALRVLVPGLAGMSGMDYGRFLLYNAAGGTIWATIFVIAGYAAGDSWQRVEHIAGRASIVLLLLVALAAATVVAARWVARHQDRFRALVAAQLDRPLLARLRVRYRRQLDFLARRIRPEGALGLSLTASLAALVAVGWVLGAIVQDVVAGDGSIRFDQPVLRWFVRHREPWLTTIMRIVTAGGASGFLIPLVAVVGALYWWRVRDGRPGVRLGAAYLGSFLLNRIVKDLTDRPRPPALFAIGHYGGSSFPSGHATQAAAVYGVLAAVLAATTRRWPRKVALWMGGLFMSVLVGISRLYLGVHWLTDVLGGWALGALWVFVVVVVSRAVERKRARPDRDPGARAASE
jgi:membrane protein DedA with SNARE-associated domain/membrane-associated phospholipid phosphatase